MKKGSARHLPLNVACAAGLPGLFLLDTGVALARGWRTRSRLDLVLICLALCASLAVLLCLTTTKCRTALQRIWQRLTAVSLAILAAGILAEALTAFWLQPLVHPPFHRRPPQRQWLYRPNPEVIAGVGGEARFTTNSLGIRGPELPPKGAAYRILCVGGSTTECTLLDDEKTWSHLLMRRLNEEGRSVWVGNVGVSGFTCVHHLRFVEESPLLDEIDCVVLLIGANDFGWFLRGNREFPLDLQDSDDRAPVWRRSHFLQLARVAWHKPQGIMVEDSAGKNYQLRRLRRQHASLCRTLPDLDKGLNEYSTRIESIVDHLRKKGTRVIFMTQPTLWDRSLSDAERSRLWLGDMPDGMYLAVEPLQDGMNAYNECLCRACKNLGVECVDLGSMNGQVKYFYDDLHFTESGAPEVARLLSKWILEHDSAKH